MKVLFGSAAIAVVFLSVSPAARAWGPQGHETVALVAQQALTPEARRGVDALLATEPGADLVGISNWADRTRAKETAAWHYLNLPRDADCAYEPARDCPGGQCVVGALEAQLRRLESAETAPERLEALKYVVHFVADLHQPLHVGFADDRGGNTFQLQAFGKGTNLHALWDSGLIRALGVDPRTLARQLAATRPADSRGTPAAWAAESCKLVSTPGFYPGRHLLPENYLEAHEPVLRQRLKLAGQRLALELNRIFDPASAPRAN